MARRLKEQKRFQETEDLLRWAVDGLRTEIGEQKVAARPGFFPMGIFPIFHGRIMNGSVDGNFRRVFHISTMVDNG